MCGFLADRQRASSLLISLKIKGFALKLRPGKESSVKSEA